MTWTEFIEMMKDAGIKKDTTISIIEIDQPEKDKLKINLITERDGTTKVEVTDY